MGFRFAAVAFPIEFLVSKTPKPMTQLFGIQKWKKVERNNLLFNIVMASNLPSIQQLNYIPAISSVKWNNLSNQITLQFAQNMKLRVF